MGGITASRTASQMPGLDIAEQRAWENFLDAALRMYGSLNKTLSEEHQLTLVDVRLLSILCHSDSGSARMGDLAEQLMSLPSRVTRQIRRLEHAGLVTREASPEDGRGVLATITDRGRDVVDSAVETYSEAVRERFLGPLTRSQMSALGENCRRISEPLRTNGSGPRARATAS